MCSGESALRLVSRLLERPDCRDLEPRLWPEGLRPQEVVEVEGGPSSGKTLLLRHLVGRALMPPLKAGVVLLDTDLHFRPPSLSPPALGQLSIFTPHDTPTLLMTLHYLKKHLTQDSTVALILIDSISAYYWGDRLNPGKARSMDVYVSDTLKVLHSCLKNFKVSVIFTRPSYFKSNAPSELSSVLNLQNINTSISLKRRPGVSDKPIFTAQVRGLRTSFSQTFTVTSDSAIEWL